MFAYLPTLSQRQSRLEEMAASSPSSQASHCSNVFNLWPSLAAVFLSNLMNTLHPLSDVTSRRSLSPDLISMLRDPPDSSDTLCYDVDCLTVFLLPVFKAFSQEFPEFYLFPLQFFLCVLLY